MQKKKRSPDPPEVLKRGQETLSNALKIMMAQDRAEKLARRHGLPRGLALAEAKREDREIELLVDPDEVAAGPPRSLRFRSEAKGRVVVFRHALHEIR